MSMYKVKYNYNEGETKEDICIVNAPSKNKIDIRLKIMLIRKLNMNENDINLDIQSVDKTLPTAIISDTFGQYFFLE